MTTQTAAERANSGSFSITSQSLSRISHAFDSDGNRDEFPFCGGQIVSVCHRRKGQKSNSTRTQGKVTNIDFDANPKANSTTTNKYNINVRNRYSMRFGRSASFVVAAEAKNLAIATNGPARTHRAYQP